MNIKNLIEYIKDNRWAEKHYYTGLQEKTLEEKYQYLKNHYEYYTMNSWNCLKSYANNVKLHNLGITSEQWDAYFEINSIDYEYIWMQLETDFDEFKTLTGCRVFFNGRSDGYLVTAPDDNNKHILSEFNLDETDFEAYDSYMEFRKGNNQYYCNLNYSWKNEIENAYYFLKFFDKFCDVVRADFINILDNYEIVTEEVTETKEVKYII